MNIKTPLSAAAISLALALPPSAMVYAGDEIEQEVLLAAEKFNAQQKYDGSKVICTREARTGTRIKTTVCRNLSSIARGQYEAKQYLDKMRTTIAEQ